MEFLGLNLNNLLNYCSTRKFTITIVCLIGLQMLNRMEYIHKLHYLHRDIKPEKFLDRNIRENKCNIFNRFWFIKKI